MPVELPDTNRGCCGHPQRCANLDGRIQDTDETIEARCTELIGSINTTCKRAFIDHDQESAKKVGDLLSSPCPWVRITTSRLVSQINEELILGQKLDVKRESNTILIYVPGDYERGQANHGGWTGHETIIRSSL